MPSVRIAHLSDLHFGMRHQADVWQSLVDHLVMELRPDALVATGDLVDTPEPALFDRVARAFRPFTQSGVAWAVAPGNHDRHAQGNAGAAGRMAAFLKRSSIAPMSFDLKFQGRIANLAQPIDWMFGRGTPPWRVRVIGIDSSIDAQYSAQGFVNVQSLGAVRAQTRSAPGEPSFDLVIALIHHHLLPIAALERSSQHAAGLFSPTILVNAGSVLEALAVSNVNLVLHGHEHERNVARYGVIGNATASDVVVVGAGSATGADTWKGCDANRASFNLIDLRDDRSVAVREVRQRAGQWVQGEAVTLIDGRGIREGRVLRRTSIGARPLSRIDRHFAFHEYRDIEVRESRTTWNVADGVLALDVQRPSGAPTFRQMRLEWHEGGASEWEATGAPGDPRFEAHRDGTPGHRFAHRVADSARLARRIELEYRWERSAALTATDIAQLGPRKWDYFRAQGMEAAWIQTSEPLDSLTLSVSLPAEMAPKAGQWQVFVGRPEGGREQFDPNPEIRSFLHVMPGGHASMTVPFPLPLLRYCIAWPVRAAFAADASVQANRDKASVQGDAIASRIAAALQPLVRRRCTVALYLPELDDDAGVLFRLCSYAQSTPGDAGADLARRPFEVHRARDEFDPILGAWYGEASWSVADPSDPADQNILLPGEETVFVLPAWQYRWAPASEPWGILRIALAAGPAVSEELAQRIALASAIVL